MARRIQYLNTADLYRRLDELRDLENARKRAETEAQEAHQELYDRQAKLASIEAAWAAAQADDDREPDETEAEYEEQRISDAKEAVEEAATELEEAESRLSDAEFECEDSELKELDELESEFDARQFRDGILLIPEDDIEQYAQEYAKDTLTDFDAGHWPFTCIDWEQAAEDLMADDYKSVDYDGDTYYYREN